MTHCRVVSDRCRFAGRRLDTLGTVVFRRSLCQGMRGVQEGRRAALGFHARTPHFSKRMIPRSIRGMAGRMGRMVFANGAGLPAHAMQAHLREISRNVAPGVHAEADNSASLRHRRELLSPVLGLAGRILTRLRRLAESRCPPEDPGMSHRIYSPFFPPLLFVTNPV